MVTYAYTVKDLGIAYRHLRKPRRAIEHYEQQFAITREIGDRQGEGNALFNSARALNQLDEQEEATNRMEEALRIYEQIGAEHLVEQAQAQLTEWQGKGGG